MIYLLYVYVVMYAVLYSIYMELVMYVVICIDAYIIYSVAH